MQARYDRYPRREAAERVSQGARIVSASIFVPGRLVGHAKPITREG